jgi:hypothetical protein
MRANENVPGHTCFRKKTQMTKSHEFYMKADLGPYMGEWVAICDDRIVSHGPTFKEAYGEAKRICPKKRLLLAMVPNGETIIPDFDS